MGGGGENEGEAGGGRTVAEYWARERKHWALRPQKPLRLIRDGEVGGREIFISNTYSLHCHHQNDSALRLAAVRAILMVR